MITKTTLTLLAYLCVAGFIADAQYCNSTTTCAGNQVCGMPTYCNIGYCGCSSSGMVFNGTMCVTPASISINGSCTIEQDCKGLYTTCSSGKCACSSATYTAKADGSDCVVPPLNSTCTTTGSSCGTYASCSSSGLCQCWTGQYTGGYTPVGGSNNVDCRSMKVGDTCSNVTDCPSNTASRACANANCNSGTYQCNSGYHWVTSETFSFSSSSFTGGCVPNNVTASVAVGQPCSDSQAGGSTYMLCSSGLTCVPCGSSYTCQNVNTPPPTTKDPNGGAANVRLDMMAVVSMLALALLRFAA